MVARKNRNTVFTPLSYESSFSHIHAIEEDIDAGRLTPTAKRQIPATVVTAIEQFCRTRKKFAYCGDEPVPRELRLNESLVLDMLDWADNWCTDNTARHIKTLHKHVENIDNGGWFVIGADALDSLIDDACDIRPLHLVESLAASTLSFQSVDAVNSLDNANHVLHPYGKVGVEEYGALFELRHTQIHTLANIGFSPRACVALAKDLFGTMLSRDGFAFYGGCAFSEAGRHADAVRSLELVGDLGLVDGRPPDWRYLSYLGRSRAHTGDWSATPALHAATESLLEYARTIHEHGKREATWLRMEAARTMCDIADGFRATNEDSRESYVEEVLEVCSGSADACWLAGARLSKLGFSHRASLDCFTKAYELKENVDTANAVGMSYFEMGCYDDAVVWLKKAADHDSSDVCVERALEQAEARKAAKRAASPDTGLAS